MENGQFPPACHYFSHWLRHHLVRGKSACWYFCSVHGCRRYFRADDRNHCQGYVPVSWRNGNLIQWFQQLGISARTRR